MGVVILGCLAVFMLFSLIMISIHCIKMEKNILDITDLVERRVLELYDVKK
jgi:hypothetical protein